MKCEVCGGDMTPMITSWFCAACDEVAANPDPVTGTLWLSEEPTDPADLFNDDDLIDEDPADDCLEPDFFSDRVELALCRFEGPVDGVTCQSLTWRYHREYRRHKVDAFGNPADFALEKKYR